MTAMMLKGLGFDYSFMYRFCKYSVKLNSYVMFDSKLEKRDLITRIVFGR
jgi:hypothetical protein